MTVEEFHRFEDASPERHEFIAGEIHAMTGGTARHAAIVGNVFFRLRQAASAGPCRVYVDAPRVQIDDDAVYYPDVMVVCTPHDEEAQVIHDPCVVVEVTSPTTAGTDRREKLAAYRRLPSLRTYLIVEQRVRLVQRHWRDDDGAWWREDHLGEGMIPIPCPATTLTLAEIYEGVQVGVVAEPHPDEPPYTPIVGVGDGR